MLGSTVPLPVRGRHRVLPGATAAFVATVETARSVGTARTGRRITEAEKSVSTALLVLQS